MANHSRYKNVAPQHRDLSLIRILTEDFRILTTEQIDKLFPMGSIARLSFRLKQLCDAGYLSARVLARFGSASKYGCVANSILRPFRCGSKLWKACK
jgi:hypothetical protein